MTREELLVKINHFRVVPFDPLIDALRAVVELHKPLYYRKGEIETKGAHCDECSKGSHGENAVEYPCPTIQAIEKELK